MRLPTDISGLISFWDFSEPPGSPRIAKGPEPYALLEGDGPVPRVEDGPFGGHAAGLGPGAWFRMPRGTFAKLDFHGEGRGFTVMAWMRFRNFNVCQAIAGIWNESREKRQYCLFFNLNSRYGANANVHGHLSDVGGPTRGHPYCVTYATGATPIPSGVWCVIGFTYDGVHSRVFVDGRADDNPRPDPYGTGGSLNPYAAPRSIYDGGPQGADFTVGAVDRAGEIGNFTHGDIGGLGIWGRALSEEEIHRLASPRVDGSR